MLITQRNFDQCLKAICAEKVVAFDTETTCLSWWDNPWQDEIGLKPRVFSLQFSTPTQDFYLDFNHSDDRLDDRHFDILNREFFAEPERLLVAHNLKFDAHHLANHGIDMQGTWHCTQAQSRVANNLEPGNGMGLDALAEKYLNHNKLDVISILKERGHVTLLKKFGHNDKNEEVLHFDRLTLPELVDYGCKDTRLCFDLAVHQIKAIFAEDQKTFYKGDSKTLLQHVMENEQNLTKVLFKMERTGMMIDRAYTEQAYESTVAEYKKIEVELNKIAGKSVDWLSAKQLKPIFDAANEPYSYTEKGNASFDSDALEDSESELAKLILKYRYHYKRAHTYFENFIWFADRNNTIHASMQQSGTSYARMSSWSPNLYNIPKSKDKEESNFKVRSCFIPKPGTVFMDADYSGAEYYMTLDYAREMPIIEMLQNGLDPHAKLRDDLQLKDRQTAKTMQFRILYGAGQEAVGRALGLKGPEAKRVGKIKKQEYFDRLPNVAVLIGKVKNVADNRGFIYNWFGRVLQYDRKTSYKALNGMIQSGVGDMTKIALVKIDALLEGRRSKQLVQIYDSILFELYPEDYDLIPQIKTIMADIYPHKVLKMKVDAGFSKTNWTELQDTLP